MADGGRYRRRRHAVYAAAAGGTIVRAPHQPHYQSRDYNALNGGIARWFAPIDDAIGSGRDDDGDPGVLARGVREPRRSARLARRGASVPDRGEAGRRRTPDAGRRAPGRRRLRPGAARSIGRTSRAATTTVHRLDGRELGAFTLTTPLDAALLDDSKVAHGVTPIEPVDPSRPAYRDVLVVTWTNGLTYNFDPGAGGTPSVPSTTSTKFRSSRRISRLVCAMAKFSRASGSDFRRAR